MDGFPKSKSYGGLYRGVIEDVADPEKRGRYRVRVANIHPQEVEAGHLPWAELAGFGGAGFGDVPAYEEGDTVWIMFEGGHEAFPILVGGVLNLEGGVPPLPPERTADARAQAQRWTRMQRDGSKIEMSTLEEEQWIKLQAVDGSYVQVSAAEGGIEIFGVGNVRLIAPTVVVESAQEIIVNSPKVNAEIAGTASINATGDANVRAGGAINIGTYTPEGAAIAVTTPTVNLLADTLVKIESGGILDIDAAGEIQVNTASRIVVSADADIDITATNASMSVTVAQNLLLDVEGNTTIDTTGNTIVQSAGTVDITTTSAGAQPITITSGADITVTAASFFTLRGTNTFLIDALSDLTIQATAALNITAAQLTLASQSTLRLEAPIIEVAAATAATLTADLGAMTIDGSPILIG